MRKSKVDYDMVLKHLKQTWLVSYGGITLLALSSALAPVAYIPFVGMALAMLIVAFGNSRMGSPMGHCNLLVRYSVYALLAASAIMLGINLVNNDVFGLGLYKFNNPELPFVSSVITFPTAAVTIAIAILRRGKARYCRDCRDRAGYSIKEILEYNVFHYEAKVLLWYVFSLSAVVSVAQLLYFQMMYIDVNINSPDMFVFFLVPIVTFGLAYFYLAMRYSSMKFEINVVTSHAADGGFATIVRYIVVCDGKILLSDLGTHGEFVGLMDTPARKETDFEEEISEDEARDIFASMASTKDFQLRRLFITSRQKQNAFHYAVFVPEGSEGSIGLEGEWFDLRQIDLMMKKGLVARSFAYEIHRIYTMTMAWKTYNRDGIRLYPIKNYRPTFRLSDFKDWTIDYADMHWLSVAENNEDRPFFRLRRFWRRHISGSDKKWRIKD